MLNNLRRRIFFDLRYLKNPRWDTGISPPELLAFIQTVEPGRALDLGCGTGTNLLSLAQNGWDVVGVDIACIPVFRARKKLKKSGYAYPVINRDVTDHLEFKESFDLILDMGCFHSLSPQGRERYRLNLKKWLAVGGVYLLYAHRRTAPGEIHGIDALDLDQFSSFLELQWMENSKDGPPDVRHHRPATWVQFRNSLPYGNKR